MTDVPKDLYESVFRTDLRSILRGLNSILGLSHGHRHRLRTLRLDKNLYFFTAKSQFDIIKFGLVGEEALELTENDRAIRYDDHKDEYEIQTSLRGEQGETLFIKELVDGAEYLKEIVKLESIKPDKFLCYQDLQSAILDSFQINSGLLFLIHLDGGSYVVNRSLLPDPESERTFFVYSRIYCLEEGDPISATVNYVQVNRYSLEITGHQNTSSVDSSQMVLPVVHLKPL